MINILFILFFGIANRIRGGGLDLYLKIQGNLIIRIISSIIVGLSVFLVLPNILSTYFIMLYVGICYFIFNLFSWGLWHDMGTIPDERHSNRYVQLTFIKSIYDLMLDKGYSSLMTDYICMTLRGFVFIIFFPLFFYQSGFTIAFLCIIIFPILWSLSYLIGRRFLDQYTNYHSTEILAGFAQGFIILIGI